MRSPESKNAIIDVVAALICHQGKILVTQRKAQDSNGGFWEFPGGKVEEGESLQAALKREIQEELEVHIEVQELIESHEMTTPTGKSIRLHLLVAIPSSTNLKLNEHDDAKWVLPSELNQVGFIPGNKLFIKSIQKWFSSKGQ